MLPTASKPDDSPLSLWQEVTPLRRTQPAQVGEIQLDAVVIGGGFTGLSAALHMAKSGTKTALLEAHQLGWGGSGRNNGQVIPLLAGAEPQVIEARYGAVGERFVNLVRESANLLFDLVAQENITCEAEQSGWFQPAHSPEYFALSEKRHAEWAKRGAPCELLDAAAGKKLLGSDFWHGGLLNPTGGHINPLMLVHGLADACTRAGVEIFENTPVSDVARQGTGWLVRTESGQIRCKSVILATNAYDSTAERNHSRSVVPVTSWQMATEPLAPEVRKHLLPGRQAVSDTRNDLHYFRYDARGRLVTGAALMLPVNTAHRLDKMLKKRFRDAFPAVEPIVFTHIWSGYVGITQDHFPHFHRLGPDYLSAIGFNGRGVALSISAGRELARAILGEPDIALPFDTVKPVLFQPFVRRFSRALLPWYRWKDQRKPNL